MLLLVPRPEAGSCTPDKGATSRAAQLLSASTLAPLPRSSRLGVLTNKSPQRLLPALHPALHKDRFPELADVPNLAWKRVAWS